MLFSCHDVKICALKKLLEGHIYIFFANMYRMLTKAQERPRRETGQDYQYGKKSDLSHSASSLLAMATCQNAGQICSYVALCLALLLYS